MSKRKPRVSIADQRLAREARHGLILIALCIVSLAGVLIAYTHVDAQRGITVDESLRSAGL